MRNSAHVQRLTIEAPVLPATADCIYCDVKFQQHRRDPIGRLQNATGREAVQTAKRLDEVRVLLTATQRPRDGR